MSQHDYVIDNANGATVRADLNNVLLAIASTNAGTSEPTTKYAGMLWLDTTNNLIKLRNTANNAWITLAISMTASNEADIDGGTIDGTVIGGNTAAAADVTTLTASSTISGTEVTGSTSVKTPKIEYTDGDDAIDIADGGQVTIADLIATTADINGGTVDGANVGASTPGTAAFTTLAASGATDLNDTLSVSGNVSLDGSATEIRFYEGANYVGFEAPALTGDQIWVLPTADGSADQVLKTDGSGNLSWVDQSSGGGGGKVLQVVEASGGAVIMTSGTVNSTGVYGSITPSATDSKVLAFCVTSGTYNNGSAGLTYSIYRGTSGEGSGSSIFSAEIVGSSGGQHLMATGMKLDSPSSTASNTYTVMHKSSNGSSLVGWCSTDADGDDAGKLVLIEIGA